MSGAYTNNVRFHLVRVVYPAFHLLSLNAAVWMPIPYSAHMRYPQDMTLLDHRLDELTTYHLAAKHPYQPKSKMRNTKYHYIRNDTIGDSSLADDMDRVAQYGGSTSLEAVAFVGTQDVNINNILDSVVIRLRRHTIFPGNEFEEIRAEYERMERRSNVLPTG